MPELTALQSVSTASLRRYLFSISQYCRSVSDLTDEDKLPPTAFHSCAEPPISLTEYILGIGRRLRFSRFAVLLASVYVARLSQRIGRAPSILSIHRLYAFSLLFACKTLGGDAPTDEAFAQNAGFPLSEVQELQAFVQRTIGRDAKEYDVEVENMHQQLEIASQTTLRSRIAVAVATAFQLQPPMAERAATFRNRSPGPQLSREPTPEPRSRDASPTLMPPALQAWPKPRSRENSPVANSRDSSLGLLSAPGEVASMLLSREPSFRPPTPSIDASPPTAPLSREGSIRPLSSRSREASGVFVMSPVVNSLLNTPRQPWDLRRSSDSQYLFGSGVSAVRGLRHGSKTDLNDISFMLPTQPEESLSQYPLPTFTAQMPQTLNADSESAPPPLLSVDAARHAPSLAPRPVFMVQRS